MTTSTARYRFEFRVLEWAEGFSRGLNGNRTALFVGFREDYTVRRVYCGPRSGFEGENKAKLVASVPAWLLYVPDEEPGSGYLEWFQLPAEVAQRFGGPYEAADFLDVRTTARREGWPASWRVLFR